MKKSRTEVTDVMLSAHFRVLWDGLWLSLCLKCNMQRYEHFRNVMVTFVAPMVSQQVKLITQPMNHSLKGTQKRTTHRKVIKTKIIFRAIHIFYILLLFRTPIRLLIILRAGTRAHINIYLL
jgi:hypothetical protein